MKSHSRDERDNIEKRIKTRGMYPIVKKRRLVGGVRGESGWPFML